MTTLSVSRIALGDVSKAREELSGRALERLVAAIESACQVFETFGCFASVFDLEEEGFRVANRKVGDLSSQWWRC